MGMKRKPARTHTLRRIKYYVPNLAPFNALYCQKCDAAFSIRYVRMFREEANPPCPKAP